MNKYLIVGMASLLCNIMIMYYAIISQETLLLVVVIALTVWNLFNLFCEIGERKL